MANVIVEKGAATAVCSFALGMISIEAGGALALTCGLLVSGTIGVAADKFGGEVVESFGDIISGE